MKQLPVKIANGLVNSTCDQVPVRVLNPSPDSRVVYKGTKIATVEGVNDEPRQPILAVQPEAREVSRTKRQALSKMMEKCASDLGAEQKEQLLQLLIEFADTVADEVNWVVLTESRTTLIQVVPHRSGSLSAEYPCVRRQKSKTYLPTWRRRM